ncbi:MAG: hypothetical protein AB1498_00885 [bacterium]
MKKNIKKLICITLIFIVSFYAVLLNLAQKKNEGNPHNLADNPENCLYCHNKTNIPAEEEKLKNVQSTHKFELEAKDCSQCHILDDNAKAKEPRFKKSIPELCGKPCHDRGALGLNHPLEVVPDFKVPSTLPLENGEITCGTCHNPHNNPVIKTKSFFGWKEEKSYFLRMDNSHGELCRVCHADYPIF